MPDYNFLNLSPPEFEDLTKDLLQKQFDITLETFTSGRDNGIDLRYSSSHKENLIIQCKRYKGSVAAGEIRDFRGAMVGRADKGLFITTGSFTPAALKEATRDGAPPIDLVDGDELAEKLKELSLGVKTELVERVSVDAGWFENL